MIYEHHFNFSSCIGNEIKKISKLISVNYQSKTNFREAVRSILAISCYEYFSKFYLYTNCPLCLFHMFCFLKLNENSFLVIILFQLDRNIGHFGGWDLNNIETAYR